MAIFHGNSIPAGGSGSYYDYEITNSLRFNKDNNPYLTHPDSFSPTSPYTVSFWVKRGKLSSNNYAYRINSADSFYFTSNDNIYVERRTGGLSTSRVFRDISSWYHIVVKSTSSDYKLYVNGVLEQTTTSGANPYSAGTFNIGNSAPSTSSTNAFDGYMAEWHWVDGQALGPENFGETGTYGDWKPKEYTGSHGSSGFHLDFKDSSSISSLGNDVSGNGNHFTVNNIATGEQYPDSPTNNFAVMNNLDSGLFATTFAGGNINMTTGGQGQEPSNMATIGMTSGKWYFEVVKSAGASYPALGIRADQAATISPFPKDNPGKSPSGYAYVGAGTPQNILNNGSYVSYGTLVGYGNGDLVSMAVDLDNNKMYWAKNGVYLNSANPSTNSNGFSITPANQTNLGAYFPCFGDIDLSSYVFNCNFGQNRGFDGNISPGGNSDDNGIGNFKYAPPAGFLSLCTANLPDPTVMPSEHFTPVIYTGTGATKSVTGVGFQPDLVWMKSRSNLYNHQQHDAVRGANKQLRSSHNQAEQSLSGTLTSFDSDGFSLGSDTNTWEVNKSGSTYVAWNWKANGSGSANTDGSISSTVSANTNAGFSIITYSGASGNGTVGHGLSKAPNLVITKSRNAADQWRVGSIQSAASMDFTDYLRLNDAGSFTDEITTWNDTAPTSSVFSVGIDSATNHPGYTYVSYCFHDVEGYSKIGSYKGNGISDGTFVNCGFRPQFLLIKPINYGDGWKLWDTTRGAQNGRYNQYPPGDLKPNQTNAENFSTAFNIDFVSNGFKWRGADGSVNAGYHYLYYAIAEQPFKHTNAR